MPRVAYRSLSLALVLALASGGIAYADQAVAATAPQRDRGQLIAGVKVGGLFAEPFSKLGASYLVDVEFGYVLPILRHHLALGLDAAYTAPSASGTTTDPRLDSSGGTYTWQAQQRELIFGLTAYYRHPIGRFTPYVGVGPRLVLLETKVSGTAGGAPFGTSTEESTKVGVGVPLGLGFTLGPGQLFGELAFLWAPLNHTVTGSSNAGSLSIAAGYRVLF